ncbi:MAG: TIGR03619 family F420-dependent LLM class oxidoreductase, partial [Acidobacteria bacterium]|nr:TIGR03619 family F420-dependent LLM class oxidoreductase [Acidobacteriota bacterium]
TLAAIAMRTRRVDLGTAVYLTTLRHPVPLAHMVGNLDLLSQGRLLLGIGQGPSTPSVRAEYAACGVEFDQRGKLQEEGLQVLKGLWSGQPYSFRGQFFRLDQAILQPLPACAGGPPVLLAAAAERPLRRIARLGDGWLPISHDPQEYSRHWEQLQGYCAEYGRDPSTLLRVLYVTLNVNQEEAQARQEMAAFLASYYGPSHQEVARRQAIQAGSPERCAEFLGGFLQAGVRHFIFRLGSSEQEAQMDRVVSEVIPQLSVPTS